MYVSDIHGLTKLKRNIIATACLSNAYNNILYNVYKYSILNHKTCKHIFTCIRINFFKLKIKVLKTKSNGRYTQQDYIQII